MRWLFRRNLRDNHAEGPVLFREVQRFRETWLWPLMVVPALAAAAYVVVAVVKFLAGGGEGEEVSLAGGALVLGIAFYCLKGFAVMIALCYAARLEVEVRNDGLYVRLAPFHLKHRRVSRDEIRRATVRSYRVFGAPGGRGYVRGRGWRAYTVKGNEGVELVTSDGKRLLIGSQAPHDLAAAIAALG